MKFLFITLIFSTISINSNGLWQETYGGTDVEYATCIIKTLDSGFAVTGYTYSYGAGNSDICLLKLRSDGSLQWAKTIGGTEADNAYCLIQSSDSSYVIVGSTKSYGLGYYEDMFILKLNSSGELSWAKTIGRNGLDECYSVKQTDDGGFIAVGYSEYYSPIYYGLMIVKISNQGVVEWTKFAEKVGISPLNPAVIQTSDGGFGIATTIDSVGQGESDMFFIKLSDAGILQWSWAIGGADYEEAFSAIQTADNGYVLAGYTTSFGAGYPDLYVVKLSCAGSLKWTRSIGGWNDDYAISVMNSDHGGFTIAGECFSYGLGAIDMYIVGLDSLGRFLWGKTIGGSDQDFMRSMDRDYDGGYIAVGRSYSFGAGESDMFIVKIDSAGNTCGNSTIPIPHIDSGGTVSKIPVNIYTISPTIMAAVPSISGWGEISHLCYTEHHPASSLTPATFKLYQNYPNPFNPTTHLRFDIPPSLRGEGGRSTTLTSRRLVEGVRLVVYDLLGREVAILVNEQLKPGTYEVDWDGSDFASGVYFYSLITNEFTQTKKLILLK